MRVFPKAVLEVDVAPLATDASSVTWGTLRSLPEFLTTELLLALKHLWVLGVERLNYPSHPIP